MQIALIDKAYLGFKDNERTLGHLGQIEEFPIDAAFTGKETLLVEEEERRKNLLGGARVIR